MLIVVRELLLFILEELEKKIEINPKEPKYLKVVWGIGYKIEKLNY